MMNGRCTVGSESSELNGCRSNGQNNACDGIRLPFPLENGDF